jgi:hydrogenase maturation protease
VSYLDSTLVGEAYSRLRPPHGDTVLVLGIGDAGMGDDGVGVHVVHQLEREPRIPRVRLLAGGLGGAALLPEFDGARAVIVVAAIADGRVAGMISYTQPQRADDLPPGTGRAMEVVRELFAAAALLGRLPSAHLYSVSIAGAPQERHRLSPPVAAAMAVVACTVHGHALRLATAGTTL